MKIVRSLLAASLALAVFSPAFAQEGDAGATLQVNRGNVMLSQEGGEFASAASGTELRTDSRIMLAEDAVGTLVYDNGCRLTLDTPGVHAVPDREACLAMLAPSSGTGAATAGAVDWQSAGILFAGTVAGAAILANMGDGDPLPPPAPPAPPPVSP